jgi:hypothetical protein
LPVVAGTQPARFRDDTVKGALALMILERHRRMRAKQGIEIKICADGQAIDVEVEQAVQPLFALETRQNQHIWSETREHSPHAGGLGKLTYHVNTLVEQTRSEPTHPSRHWKRKGLVCPH